MNNTNETAERSLISLVCDHPEVYWECERKGVSEESFNCTARKRIWRFIHTAHSAGKKPDRLMVAAKVESSKSDSCVKEFEQVPASGEVFKHHAPVFIEEVVKAWKRRRFKQLQFEAEEKMKYDDPDVVAHWLASELAQLESHAIDVKTIDSVAPQVEQGWQDARSGKLVGVPSGFKQFNQIIGCYRKKIVTGIGATTNTGKSIIAKMEAMHCAIELSIPCVLITPEDPDEMVVSSMAGIRGRTNTFALDMGLQRGNMTKGVESLYRIKGHPLYIIDMPQTGETLEAAMNLMKAKYGVELVIIDHLHYIRQNNIQDPRVKYDYLMGIISGNTKILDVSTLMFAQLSREANKAGRPPRLSDFKETGNIENEIRTGGMAWTDPGKEKYRIVHFEKSKGYASERRLAFLEPRGDNVPGFDEVPREKWPSDETVMMPWKEKGKDQWKV
jgi:replicative DNA helicase